MMGSYELQCSKLVSPPKMSAPVLECLVFAACWHASWLSCAKDGHELRSALYVVVELSHSASTAVAAAAAEPKSATFRTLCNASTYSPTIASQHASRAPAATLPSQTNGGGGDGGGGSDGGAGGEGGMEGGGGEGEGGGGDGDGGGEGEGGGGEGEGGLGEAASWAPSSTPAR